MIARLRSLASRPAQLARVLLALAIAFELAVLVLGPDSKAAKAAITEAKAAHDATSHWEPYADVGIHAAALANLGLFALLALTAGWWTRPFEVTEETYSPPHARRPWWKKLTAPALVLLFAVLYGSTSFATKSLWWDEMWAVKQCSLGTWKPDKKNADELKFQPTTWKKCAFYYQKPTNHAPMSVLQKTSLAVWQKVMHKKPSDFNELVIRLPALIASGIALVLLFRLCGLAGGVPVAAMLLYLHPMHLHYGVDARAYALIVPLCISAILAERKVIFTKGRSLGPWVWLALNQAGWIWTYPNAVLDVLVLFIVLAVFLWRGEANHKDRVTAMLRLVAAHVFAAALWLQLFLPNLLQALNWAGQENQGHELSTGVFQDTVSWLAFGMTWSGFGNSVEAQGLTSVIKVAGSPMLGGLMIAVFFGLALLGIFWALRHAPKTGWLLAAPLISSIIYAAVGSAFGIYFYPRFVIAALPVLVVGISLCGNALADYSQKRRSITYVIMALFMIPTMHQRALIMSRPHSTPGDAARFVEQWSANQGKTPLVLCYGLGREVMSVYYPKSIPVSTADEVVTARDKAMTDGRSLLVIQGYTLFNRTLLPDGMKLLDDRLQFAERGAWPALDPDFYFRVLEARPGK